MSKREIRYLDPADVRVAVPEGGAQPRVEIRGVQTILNARIRRVFPLSDPDAYISLQDAEGHEVGILPSLEGLDSQSKRAAELELDRRYFAPVISKIDVLRQEAGMWFFKVRTQRGDAEFYVRNWRDSAYEVGVGRWQILSVDGLRYTIANLNSLDERSQSLLDEIF